MTKCVYKTHSRSFHSTFFSLFRKTKLDCRFIQSRRGYRLVFTPSCTQNCKNCYFLPRHNCRLRVNLPFHVCFWSCYPVSLRPNLAVVFLGFWKIMKNSGFFLLHLFASFSHFWFCACLLYLFFWGVGGKQHNDFTLNSLGFSDKDDWAEFHSPLRQQPAVCSYFSDSVYQRSSFVTTGLPSWQRDFNWCTSWVDNV